MDRVSVPFQWLAVVDWSAQKVPENILTCCWSIQSDKSPSSWSGWRWRRSTRPLLSLRLPLLLLLLSLLLLLLLLLLLVAVVVVVVLVFRVVPAAEADATKRPRMSHSVGWARPANLVTPTSRGSALRRRADDADRVAMAPAGGGCRMWRQPLAVVSSPAARHAPACLRVQSTTTMSTAAWSAVFLLQNLDWIRHR